MIACFMPSIARGDIMAPPSKSMAHRYMIAAALSDGKSRIDNISYSEDILATIDCIRAIGATVNEYEDHIEVIGRGISAGGKVKFCCRECGSTLRFFVPIAMMLGTEATLVGSKTLLSRPMSVYEEIAAKQNIEYCKDEAGIHVKGKLCAGKYEVPGNISSQFITGLLFVLPLLDGDSTIRLIPPVDSRSYIELTLKALKLYGIEAYFVDELELYVSGNQQYRCADVTVEGDFSNAAFLDVFNTIGGEVKVGGLSADSTQGDRVYKEYFQKLIEGKPTLDISNCPDLGPVLMAVAAMNNGGIFTGTRRLAMKESDRGRAMCEELGKLGIESRMDEDEIEIMKGELVPPSETLNGWNDHRIVMAVATLLSRIGGSVDDAQAVNKSFPDYYDRIRRLGIEVSVRE